MKQVLLGAFLCAGTTLTFANTINDVNNTELDAQSNNSEIIVENKIDEADPCYRFVHKIERETEITEYPDGTTTTEVHETVITYQYEVPCFNLN